MPTPWSYDIPNSPAIPMAARPGLGSRPVLPLQGLTILAVEDSRYACEALRLMCHRAGARLRRAETLALARAHLRVYRPDVVIIDLGLPDGRGEALITDLVRAGPRPTVILGTSGNPQGRAQSLDAGADGFLEKPYASLPAFCADLLAFLPDRGGAANIVITQALRPDPLALHDDLTRAARAMAGDPDLATQRYVTGFLSGIAHHAQDTGLAQAAALADAAGTDGGFRQLRDVVADRLATPAAFPRTL